MDAATVTAITGSVDFTTIIVGIGAIAASVALVLISVRGARMLLSMIRG
jgi:hypothetical protein